MAQVVILSGAGLSAESGISTFRGSGGLWENHSVFEVCSSDSLINHKDATIRFYDARREQLKDVQPNHAHKVIADLKKKYPKIYVVTQNIDDLLEKAGCEDIKHLHGFLTNLKCSDDCGYTLPIGYQKQGVRFCKNCGAELRPDIVFFGEGAPGYEELYNEMIDCEMLVVIGTSGEVMDVNYLRRGISHTILNNLEPSRNIKAKKFSKVLYKPATEAIDEIAGDIESFMKNIV